MISYICIIIAFIIPLICAAIAKLSKKGYDNSSPRDFLNSLEGKGKRANYAQANSHEAFAPFAVGVVAAHQMNANPATIQMLAIIFITARIIYCYGYITDRPTLRSIFWTIGLISVIGLYLTGLSNI